ncbi:SE1832 family protein [uncultured Metabacillus sp.]|uniref:SE1832 family protein n=1 Tax=uncultured Metabacillus sp. TaxID=2860135 RepID=UPI002637D845|nr:SE1832 family protein [uncultured Metabacillus sp.]
MEKEKINQKISELKMEYIRIQGDIEKLESTGHSITKLEEKLQEIEAELKAQYAHLNE